MKITYIITRTDQYGGAQIHVRDLSQWMSDHGHEVSVIAGSKGVLCNDFQQHNVRFGLAECMTRQINPWKDLKAFFQIRNHLKEFRPDIVSCHSSKAGWLGRCAAWSLRIPSVFTAHGWAFTDGIQKSHRFIYTQLERISALFCKHIICVSKYDKYLALKNHITKAKYLTVVHNGKHLRDEASSPKRENDVPQLCMIARFSAQKDHRTLLHALGKVKDMDWHLNLVGDGDNHYAVNIAKNEGILNRITFHGQRSDVPDYLETQDIFLLISNWEGFPRSIIEAMRASLPVIATKTAGIPESVKHEKTGIIVPPKDQGALADAIRDLLSNTTKRQEMGAAGFNRFKKEFTFDQMANKTLNVYQNVLGLTLSKQAANKELAPQDTEPKLSQHS